MYIPGIAAATLAWRAWPSDRAYEATLFGARLLRDGPPTAHSDLAIARNVARVNPQLSVNAAMALSAAAVASARRTGLPPEFLAATLLQESAFDPRALSAAGAIGIGQFMPETAAMRGVDPFDPFAAIAGSADLLAAYVDAYRGKYADPYAAALGAYNAGPGAVAAYRGVPPYAETRTYIDDIYERWARILEAEAE